MKTYYSLSSRVNTAGKSQIMMRFVVSRGEIWRGKTKLYITPENWDNKAGEPRPRRDAQDKRECIDIRQKLFALTTAIIEKYNETNTHDKNWLKKTIDNIQWKADGSLNILSNTTLANMTLTESLNHMIKIAQDDGLMIASSCSNYKGLARKFEAFENYHKCLVKEFDDDVFAELLRFIKDSSEVSNNTMASVKTRVMRWWHWCYSQDKTLANIDGKSFMLRPRAYGTPYYLTKEDRDKLYRAKMTKKQTEMARDIFVFQCLVGCRYSDLIHLTQDNIQDGYLVYIAKKTIRSEPKTIRVPLHPIAKEIIAKYNNTVRKTLFIHRTECALNQQIRRAIKETKIDRIITIRDKRSGEQVQKWLSEVASTHMARRTFIGCLYEQGFRESDICSMSGHKEGSVSIQRYRAVSDERKQMMIDSI